MPKASGFRTDHSIEYASLELVDRIIVEMDKINIPMNIFLDLSKAFDTLDHKILLDKSEHYGVNGVSLRLMEGYLTIWKQYVEIDGSNSDMLSLTTSVPQGSIYSPLLFIITIMILHKQVNCLIVLYMLMVPLSLLLWKFSSETLKI